MVVVKLRLVESYLFEDDSFVLKSITNMKHIILILTVLALTACSNSKNTMNKQSQSSFKPIEIQLIRNATLRLNYNGQNILVDPSLSPKNSFMSFKVANKNLNPTVDITVPIKEITKNLDAILVTHTHLDHFDDGAKKHLLPTLPLFGQPSDVDVFKKSPFTNISIVEHKTEFNGITLIRTGGKHGPEHMLEALGKVSGFILKAKDYPTIYIVGDCLLDDEIKSNINTYNPDIIIVNSGGAVFGGSQILMNEKDVVDIAQRFPQVKLIAVHMESLDHCLTTRQMVKDEAKKENVKVYVPNDGEIIQL